MKKRWLVLSVLVIIIIAATVFLMSRRSAYRLAELHTGIEISERIKIADFQDEWYPNGDGETLIVFDLDESQLNEIERSCISQEYESLPIKDELPDHTIYQYINKTDSIGYYHFKQEGNDKRDYLLVVLDKASSRFYVYYAIY